MALVEMPTDQGATDTASYRPGRTSTDSVADQGAAGSTDKRPDSAIATVAEMTMAPTSVMVVAPMVVVTTVVAATAMMASSVPIMMRVSSQQWFWHCH